MEFDEAMHLMGLLERPKVTVVDVRTEFRRKAFLCHPDKGGDEEAFKQLKQAYDVIVEHTDQLSEDDSEDVLLFTADGYPISALGKGLTKVDVMGAKPCEHCDGKGYYRGVARYTERQFINCPKCVGTRRSYRYQVFGYYYERCPKCRGYRKIMGKICQHCEGKGRIYRFCETCSGRGFLENPEYAGSVEYENYRCNDCKGTGEVELFNPVIPRNAVMGRR